MPYTDHESLFLRVNEGCAIILDLSILHGNKVKKWFTDKHKQEMLMLILDAIQRRLRTVYDIKAYKKEEQKKDGDQDLNGIIRGNTVKVGYKFIKRAVSLHCMLPDESVQSCPESDDCLYSGGGYNSIALFPEKLNVYVCEYKQTYGQQTTAELAHAISTGGQVVASISDYFSRDTQTDAGTMSQSASAIKKRVKLKRIVKNSSKPKPSSPDPFAASVGGFLSSERHDSNAICDPTVATTSSIPNEYQCNRVYANYDKDEDVDDEEEPIYIESGASSDSADSYVFDREDVASKTNRQNSTLKDMASRTSRQITVPKDIAGRTSQQNSAPKDIASTTSRQNSAPKEVASRTSRQNYSPKVLMNKEKIDGRRELECNHKSNNDNLSPDELSRSEVYHEDEERNENQTELLEEPLSFLGCTEGAKDDVKEMDEISETAQTSCESFKLPNRSSKMRQLPQRQAAGKKTERLNKLRSKLKCDKRPTATGSRKRPLSNSDDGDDESLQDGYTSQGPKNKRPLYDNSIGSKSRVTDIGRWLQRVKDQKQGRDNDQTIGSNAKENAKPTPSDIPSIVDVDIVDLCSDEEDEGEGYPSDNDSLIDVIGDKRDVRRLDEGDIAYLMKRNKQYFKNIFSGKIPCKRHQDYKAGGFLRADLGHSVRFGPFTDEHPDTIMKALINVFCRRHSQYFDYVSKVLLPEALAKICMDVHHISHQEAEKFLADTPSASFCV